MARRKSKSKGKGKCPYRPGEETKRLAVKAFSRLYSRQRDEGKEIAPASDGEDAVEPYRGER